MPSSARNPDRPQRHPDDQRDLTVQHALLRQRTRPIHRCLRMHGHQYLGPTNSSSRATAPRFATEIVFGLEYRHSTPSRSKVSPHSARMSFDSLAKK